MLLQESAAPLEIPLVCAVRGPLVEVIFRQPIICDVLNLDIKDKTNDYQRYNLQLAEFVDWPRPLESFYVPADEVLIYKHRAVNHCPRVDDLVYGEEGKPPLPSLFEHIVASSPIGLARSWTEASSSARVLRSGNTYGSSEPSSPATSRIVSPSRHIKKIHQAQPAHLAGSPG